MMKNISSTLQLTVKFDGVPSDDMLKGILFDVKLRGTVTLAKLQVNQPALRDLLKEDI